jgi:hypothetical protein
MISSESSSQVASAVSDETEDMPTIPIMSAHEVAAALRSLERKYSSESQRFLELYRQGEADFVERFDALSWVNYWKAWEVWRDRLAR